MGGTAAGQLLTVLISPVLSRLFEKQDFGVLGAFSLLLTFLSPIVGGRYDLAIPVAKDDKESTEAMAAAMLTTTIVSILVATVMLAAGPWVADLIREPQAGKYFFLLPISLWMVGAYQALNYWAIREREYILTARTKLVQGIALALSQIAAGFLHLGQLGLVLADIVGRSAGKLTIATQVWARHKQELKALTWPGIKSTAYRYREYPLYAAPAALVHAGASALPGLVLGVMYNSAVLGLFFFSYRYIWTPVSLLGQSLAQVFNGEGAEWAKTDPARLERGYWSLVKRLALLGILPFGTIALIGRPVFTFVFGSSYADAGTYAQILSLGWYVQFVVGPVLPTLNLLERQKWVLAADAVGIALIAGTFFAAAQNHWPVTLTLGFYTASVTVMYTLLLALGGRAVNIHARH